MAFIPPMHAHVHFQFSPQLKGSTINCCTTCCTGQGSSNENLVRFPKDDVALRPDEKLQIARLEQESGGKKTLKISSLSRNVSKDTIKASLDAIYSAYGEAFGPVVVAIGTIWQGIDFLDMYTQAKPLTSHVLRTCEIAFESIHLLKDSLDFVVQQIKESPELQTGDSKQKKSKAVKAFQAAIKECGVENSMLKTLSDKIRKFDTIENSHTLSALANATDYKPFTMREAVCIVEIAKKIQDTGTKKLLEAHTKVSAKAIFEGEESGGSEAEERAEEREKELEEIVAMVQE